MSSSDKEYGYIAYIDEAGDPSLKRVRPIDDEGGTEWLVLSAVVIRTLREPLVKGWVENIVSELGIKQRNDLHYQTLSLTRKVVAGQMLSYAIGVRSVRMNKPLKLIKVGNSTGVALSSFWRRLESSAVKRKAVWLWMPDQVRHDGIKKQLATKK